MWVGSRLLAGGLVLAFVTAGTWVHSTQQAGHGGSINPSTWAPTRAGVYFFDRSNVGRGSPADFARRESEFGRKFDGHLYYLPTDVTRSDLADARWSLAVDHVPFVILSWSTGTFSVWAHFDPAVLGVQLYRQRMERLALRWQQP